MESVHRPRAESRQTTPGGPGLNGLQIGKHYRFKCAEATEPDPLWRNQKTLYLQSIETPELPGNGPGAPCIS